MSEITPGIAKLVAYLQAEGFVTTDSGDGVTNVALQMECAEDVPHVFISVPNDQAHAEADRLMAKMAELGVEFESPDARFDEPGPVTIRASYDPILKNSQIILIGIVDEDLWGPDPELPRKRLEYQIRYCDEWIADPPVEKMLEAGQTEAEVEEAKTAYAEMRQRFVAELEALRR